MDVLPRDQRRGQQSGMEVFTILVSYFDEVRGESVVEHYCSFECIKIDAMFRICLKNSVDYLSRMEFPLASTLTANRIIVIE